MGGTIGEWVGSVVGSGTVVGDFIEDTGNQIEEIGWDWADPGSNGADTPVTEEQQNPVVDERYPYNSGVTWDPSGFPNTVMPAATTALHWQFEADRRAAQRREALWSDAQGVMGQATDLLQSYRPGGAAALASGLYQGRANLYAQQASMHEAPDMLMDYRRHAEALADREAARARDTEIYVGAGVAVANQVGNFTSSGANNSLQARMEPGPGAGGGEGPNTTTSLGETDESSGPVPGPTSDTGQARMGQPTGPRPQQVAGGGTAPTVSGPAPGGPAPAAPGAPGGAPGGGGGAPGGGGGAGAPGAGAPGAGAPAGGMGAPMGGFGDPMTPATNALLMDGLSQNPMIAAAIRRDIADEVSRQGIGAHMLAMSRMALIRAEDVSRRQMRYGRAAGRAV